MIDRSKVLHFARCVCVYYLYIFLSIGFHKKACKGVNCGYFFSFKLYWFAPPKIFHSHFPGMEFSIRPNIFFQFIATLCIRTNLVNLPKQLFIINAWSFTRNRIQALSETLSQNLLLPFIVKTWSFTKIRLCQSLKLNSYKG